MYQMDVTVDCVSAQRVGIGANVWIVSNMIEECSVVVGQEYALVMWENCLGFLMNQVPLKCDVFGVQFV